MVTWGAMMWWLQAQSESLPILFHSQWTQSANLQTLFHSREHDDHDKNEHAYVGDRQSYHVHLSPTLLHISTEELYLDSRSLYPGKLNKPKLTPRMIARVLAKECYDHRGFCAP